MKKYLFLVVLLTNLFSNDFLLEDINSTSEFYGTEVGPSLFENEVAIVYFGHYN